jgi:hypothetical protein
LIFVLLLRRYHELSRSEFIWINVVINRESHNEPNFKLRHMIYDTWHMTPDTWHMIYDTWYMTYDTWYMTHDTWHMTHDICLKFICHVSCQVSCVICHMSGVIYVRNTKLYFLIIRLCLIREGRTLFWAIFINEYYLCRF